MTKKTLTTLALLLASVPAHGQSMRSGDRLIPPLQYDRPYQGSLVLKRGLDERDMPINCPMVPPFGYPRLGCSYRWPERCVVFLADDKIIRAAGHTPSIIFRHEIGHCHGWGNDHKGARSEEEAVRDAMRATGLFYPLPNH
jgi:hypothetical protein